LLALLIHKEKRLFYQGVQERAFEPQLFNFLINSRLYTFGANIKTKRNVFGSTIFSRLIFIFFTLFDSQSFWCFVFNCHFFATSFIMPTGHEFSVDEKVLIFKVIRFCEQEKTGPIIPLNNVIERISTLLGISERSVNRMKKELNELIEQEKQKQEEEASTSKSNKIRLCTETPSDICDPSST